MKELRSQAIVSDVGVTVMDWKRALWSTSVMSRFLGGYHPKPLKEKWTEIGNDVDLWKSKVILASTMMLQTYVFNETDIGYRD